MLEALEEAHATPDACSVTVYVAGSHDVAQGLLINRPIRLVGRADAELILRPSESGTALFLGPGAVGAEVVGIDVAALTSRRP